MIKTGVAPVIRNGSKGVGGREIGQTPHVSCGTRPILNFENPHIIPILKYIEAHPGTTSIAVKDGIGTSRGNRKHITARRQIVDCVEMLLFSGFITKKYHRLFTTPKAMVLVGGAGP